MRKLWPFVVALMTACSSFPTLPDTVELVKYHCIFVRRICLGPRLDCLTQEHFDSDKPCVPQDFIPDVP